MAAFAFAVLGGCVAYWCQLQILADNGLFHLSQVKTVDGVYNERDLEHSRAFCLARQLPNKQSNLQSHSPPRMRCGNVQVTGTVWQHGGGEPRQLRNDSETTPKRLKNDTVSFPSHFRAIPESFPSHSRVIPESFPSRFPPVYLAVTRTWLLKATRPSPPLFEGDDPWTG